MTWEEIDKDWGGLQKKHRMEIAQAVARYCIGHKMQEVAERLGYGKSWVCSQLDYAGIGEATGGVGGTTPLASPGGKQRATDDAVRKVARDFAPLVAIKLSDDGQGNQSIAELSGDDAEAFEPYIEHYVNEGHEPAAATRLAKAEWAAEAAVEAGVIKETTNKRNEKVNQILFPTDAKDTFELDLKHHMAKVKSAARFLDESKMNRLRSKSTCEKVAEANKVWQEQIERVLDNHPTFNKG